MKRASREEILKELSAKWAERGKRHLYLVLGKVSALAQFEKDLSFAKAPGRQPLDAVLSVNQELLKRLPGDEADRLINGEAKYPTMITERLAREFDALVKDSQAERDVVVLKDLELVFAFDLDLASLRLRAVNGKHIVLLLPGHCTGGRIILYHEAEERFHRALPTNLVMDAHIWEIGHAE
jgi:hypothetical protein